MRVLTSFGPSFAFAIALSVGLAKPGAAGCDTIGNIQFVCDQAGPEDLALVPGGEWVIATAYARDKGGIRLINVRDKTTTIVFPTATPAERFDKKTYGSCPGPVDPMEKEKFQTHGIYLQPGKTSFHAVYVVHHGEREAIEVFELDARAKVPTLTWIGCAIAPDPIGLNAVIALPDGGFAATNWLPRGGDATARDRMMAGQNNGELWEWHTGTGWKIVPGSEASGANGLEISKMASGTISPNGAARNSCDCHAGRPPSNGMRFQSASESIISDGRRTVRCWRRARRAHAPAG